MSQPQPVTREHVASPSIHILHAGQLSQTDEPGVWVSNVMFAEMQQRSRDAATYSEQYHAALKDAARAKEEADDLRKLLRLRIDRLRQIGHYVRETGVNYFTLRNAFLGGHIRGEQDAKGKNISLWQTSVTAWLERKARAPKSDRYVPTDLEIEDFEARQIMRDRHYQGNFDI